MAKPKAISAEDWKWQVESAANTLIESEKIKKDKKLLKAARVELQKQLDATKEAVKET